MEPKGTGLLPDPADYRPDSVYYSLGVPYGTMDLPEQSSGVVQWGRFDLDQTYTHSCVWFAYTQMLWILSGVLGMQRRILMSPFAGYWASRKRAVAGGDIVDVGCDPAHASMVLKEVGFAPWASWPSAPEDAGKVDSEPPLDVFLASRDRTWLSDMRLSPFSNLALEIRKALHLLQKPVGIGLTVDAGYISWKHSDGPWERTGPALGRHMVTAAAYTREGVITVGSYGLEHGDSNKMLVSWSAVLSSESGPFVIPKVDFSKVPK